MTSDSRVHVAVVESQPLMRRGLSAALGADPRLRVSADESSLTALSGAAFDVCVVGLFGIGSSDDLQRRLQAGPVLVYTDARRWEQWVAAWANGAGGVVSRYLGGASVADAVWEVARDVCWLGPQLAVALSRALEEISFVVDPRLRDLLRLVSDGRRTSAARADVGLDSEAYTQALSQLRRACVAVGLDRLDLDTGAPPPPEQLFLPEPRPTTLPAEALLVRGREMEVLRELASGCSLDEAAARLFLSRHTVRRHLANAMNRFGIARQRAIDQLSW